MSSHSIASQDFLAGHILLGILYSIIGIFLSVGPVIALFGTGGWNLVRRTTSTSWRLVIGALWGTMICGFVAGITVHSILHFAPAPGATATIFVAYFFRKGQQSEAGAKD
ncbi:hypothetical protein GCM10023196_093280 [Actinoallomurus vinaceus]|uniref:Uncharacterized protein n=1 Tax=Actinoallomurus vinaceus TaxID=1080074 RepID=A0ABP8UR29_9ACTN